MIRHRVLAIGLASITPVLVMPCLPVAAAQTAQDQNAAADTLTPAALQQLVGRIALYPDDLLSVVLPASTQPLQIVQAQRFLDQHKANSSLKPPSNWDPSVVALLNYPDVLSMMNSDLDWTQQLGDAVVTQQAEVLNAIQAFRKQVYDAGNLKSNDKQTVTTEGQNVVVQSADSQTIYVPQYNPQTVVTPVAVGAPLPYYYSPPYPYYASPAATFATGAVFGTAIGFAIGWASSGIYSGNWGGGSYYGGNANINRTNNINVNNARLTDAQRTQFNNRVTQNRENAWRPDRSATARQQASLRTNGQAGRVNSADVRAGLANRSGTAGGARTAPQARQNIQQNQANRGGGANRGGNLSSRQLGASASNRAPGNFAANRPSAGGGQRLGQGGGRPAFQQSGGAFGGIQNGGAANRYSSRGAASLRSSNSFGGGGYQARAGGGYRGGGGGGRGGGGGFRR